MGLFLKKFITNYRDKRQMKDADQLLFLERLLRLLQHGYSFVDALEILQWNKDFIAPAKTITDSLLAGKYLDESFEIAGFHQNIISYLYFVRYNNDLESSIERAIVMFKQRITNKKKFTQIIRYPVILGFIFFLLLFFLKRNVLPSFIDLFQYSQDSSSFVLYSIILIDMLMTIIGISIVLVLISFFGYIFYYQKWPIERQIKLYKKVPIYRSFLRLQTSYYFATHISMFLQTGMSIKNVLQEMSNQQKVPILAHYTALMQNQLKQGYQLDHLLMNFYFIEQQIALIFESNNNYDSLVKDLSAYADFVMDELEKKTTKVLMLIQPVFFIILASFIIFIYVTLMWPMFQLIQTV